MQAGQGRARFQPELVVEQAAQVLVGAQRVGLAPGPVQREHSRAPQPFAQRAGGGELGQLAHQLGVAPAGQVVVDALLDRGQPGLLQTSSLAKHEGGVDDVGQGRSAPLRERRPQRLRRPGVITDSRLLTGADQQGLEAGSVDRIRVQLQQVAVRPGEQHTVTARVSQQLAEPGDVHPHGMHRPVTGVLAPQPLHQPVGGHHLVDRQHQQGQQRPLPRTADHHAHTRVVHDVDRAEDAKLHRRLRHLTRAQPARRDVPARYPRPGPSDLSVTRR